jgi:signal transduction histidine kinase
VPFNFSLLRSSTFRLAAVYLLVFALSVGGILGYVYWKTVVLLEQQTDDAIRTEVLGLSDQYQLLGLQGVADLVKRRSTGDGDAIYLLVNPERERISGNLESLPSNAGGSSGFIDFPIDAKIGPRIDRHIGRGYYAVLPGGYRVLVGRDVEAQRSFADLIRRTLYWALGLAAVAGIGGGLWISRNFLRRVDAITETSRSIMDGDLSQRMPVTGSNDELDRLSHSLNDMLDQISRLMLGMKDVSSNVAHDLKSPLTRLKARVENALRSSDPVAYRDALTATIDECDHMLTTFNALMSIARTEAGQAREGMQHINAATLLHDVAELYEPMAEDQDGTLTTEAAEHLPVRGDRQLLAQALSNLVDNALKYGGVPPRIAFAGALDGKNVVLSVSDKGHGIAAADRERVKDRFVRLDESRTKPGNGLGLSLVSAVVKLHGGTLLIEDNQPGLRVKLVLPQAS